MWPRRVIVVSGLIGVLLLAWGCSSSKPVFIAKPEPWRLDEEHACLSSGLVRSNPSLISRAALGGPSACGAAQPFEMHAALGGRVQLRPAALLRCPMVPAIERWVQRVVDPAARLHFGVPLVELKVAASFACRPINNISGGRLSEHGHANAIDVSEFYLADGRVITVKAGWWGDMRERAFLRAVHGGGCEEFTTVLGPNADSYHRDHFHLDLARHGRDGHMRICK